MLRNTLNKAFTLAEMMIVVSIIGILATVSVPAYINYVKRAKLAEIKSMTEQVVRRILTCASTNFTDGASCNESANSLDGGLSFASNYFWLGGEDMDKARIYPFTMNGRKGRIPSSDTLLVLFYLMPDSSTVGGYYCYYYIDWKSGKVTDVYNYAFDGSVNNYQYICDAK